MTNSIRKIEPSLGLEFELYRDSILLTQFDPASGHDAAVIAITLRDIDDVISKLRELKREAQRGMDRVAPRA